MKKNHPDVSVFDIETKIKKWLQCACDLEGGRAEREKRKTERSQEHPSEE